MRPRGSLVCTSKGTCWHDIHRPSACSADCRGAARSHPGRSGASAAVDVEIEILLRGFVIGAVFADHLDGSVQLSLSAPSSLRNPILMPGPRTSTSGLTFPLSSQHAPASVFKNVSNAIAPAWTECGFVQCTELMKRLRCSDFGSPKTCSGGHPKMATSPCRQRRHNWGILLRRF